MTKTLETLRAELARSMGFFYSGTATATTTTTLTDTNALARLEDDDVLIGAVLYLCYTDGSTDDEGESRRITDYDGSTHKVTVEHVFSADPSDTIEYHIYRSLTVAQWDQAINEAIRSAWPEIREVGVWSTTLPSATTYDLSSVSPVAVREVWTLDTGRWAYYGHQTIPPSLWRFTGGIDGTATLRLLRPIETEKRYLYVEYEAQLAELSDPDDTTDLDPDYLLKMARAFAHETLAGEASDQEEAMAQTQRMMYWQEQAAIRKASLGALVYGTSAPVKVK